MAQNIVDTLYQRRRQLPPELLSGMSQDAPLAPPQPEVPAVQTPNPNDPLDPQSGPPGASTYDTNISGVNRNAPIANMRKAQSDEASAGADMAAASSTPVSLKRGILSTLAGGAMGALAGGQAGVQFGSELANRPRAKAMGLAAQRAAAAKERFGQEKDIAGVESTQQQRDTEAHAENRLTAKDAADRAQAEREQYAPTEAGGRIVQAPKLAPAKGGQAPVNDLGPAYHAPTAPHIEFKANKDGHVFELSVDASGNPTAKPVMGPDGKPLMVPEPASKEFDTYMDNFQKANPQATPQQTVQAILKYKETGPGVVVAGMGQQQTTVTNTAADELAAKVSANPKVKAAIASGDPNAYKAAVEEILSQVPGKSPSYGQYINAARERLLKSAPTRPPQKSGSAIDQVLGEIGKKYQNQGPK